LTVKMVRVTFKTMITGFNTDVPHQDRVYHVQTEDRGTKDNPVLESLVYIGGTIIAKKLTPYADKISQGANDATIASLLKRQHQVIIAAIKAGRIEDLIKHSAIYNNEKPQTPLFVTEENFVPVLEARPEAPQKGKSGFLPEVPTRRKSGFLTDFPPQVKSDFIAQAKKNSGSLVATIAPENVVTIAPEQITAITSEKITAFTPEQVAAITSEKPAVPKPLPSSPKLTKATSGILKTGSLNLDEVISDYLKRSSEQEKLDLKVIAPSVFIAGKTITLRIEVKQGDKIEPDAIVTVKVIGTAFKPQVFIGRAAADGIATFNLVLPAFSSGTAAIVIEVQSRYGRGELKHLIRRA
jgi:hypothetical protein